MTYEQACLGALNDLMTGVNNSPESRKAYENAAAELGAFLKRHAYYGEAAVMIAALTLSQDEDDTVAPSETQPNPV